MVNPADPKSFTWRTGRVSTGYTYRPFPTLPSRFPRTHGGTDEAIALFAGYIDQAPEIDGAGCGRTVICFHGFVRRSLCATDGLCRIKADLLSLPCVSRTCMSIVGVSDLVACQRAFDRAFGWRYQVAALVMRGFRVIVPDQLGCVSALSFSSPIPLKARPLQLRRHCAYHPSRGCDIS